MQKKVRFGDLVRNSGRPEVLTLWSEPGKNPTLTTATRQNRVLTVIQEPGKTDYGIIGPHLQPGSAYLIFPRPLQSPLNTKVIGINHQLVEEPATAVSSKPEARGVKSKPARAASKPEVRKPKLYQFKVKVRRIACRVHLDTAPIIVGVNGSSSKLTPATKGTG